MSPKEQRSRPATRSPSSSSAAIARKARSGSAAVVLAIAIAIAGCGQSGRPASSSSAAHPTAPAHPGAPGAPGGSGSGGPTASAPLGHLSRAEYRSIEGEYTRLHPLQNATDLSGAAARAKSACALLERPDTRLVQLVRVDCLHAVRFFAALGAVQTAADDCRGASCLAGRYENLANALSGVLTDGAELNAELARRHITGLCAASVGIRQRDLTALRAATIAATGAADAIRAGEPDVYSHYSHALDRAFASQDPHDSLTGIRQACNPDHRSAPKSQPAPVPAPKAKPRAKPRRHLKPRPRTIKPGSGLNI